MARSKKETKEIALHYRDSGPELETKITPKEKIKPITTTKDSLVCIYPPGPYIGERYILQNKEITIGRDLENDLIIEQDIVSRKHAKIIYKDGNYIIVDLNSTNGTYVNHKLIKSHLLRSGDLITIGGTIFKFISGDDVENAYHEEIYRLTIIDGLTDAYNKRYLLEVLKKELERAKRYKRDLSLLMLDIDFFKKINDNYGHLVGDKVLRDLVGLIKANIRQEEIIGRYGGEEFVLVLPETDSKGAYMLAERLRKIIELYKFIFEDVVIPVTVSIGVSSLNGREDIDYMKLIEEADANLYKAKKSGRNRVVV